MLEFRSFEWPGLDMIELENLRKWIEYNPTCYTEKIQSGELDELRLKEDALTLLRIKKLYALIIKIDGDLSINERHFNLQNPHSFEEDREYKKLVNSIPRLSISYYASIKLTDEERTFAYDFMKKCNKENSEEMMEYAKNYPNFFVGSYMVELLIHHPESDYTGSVKNIGTTIGKAVQKLTKKFDDIRIREQKDWERARHTVRS